MSFPGFFLHRKKLQTENMQHCSLQCSPFLPAFCHRAAFFYPSANYFKMHVQSPWKRSPLKFFPEPAWIRGGKDLKFIFHRERKYPTLHNLAENSFQWTSSRMQKTSHRSISGKNSFAFASRGKILRFFTANCTQHSIHPHTTAERNSEFWFFYCISVFLLLWCPFRLPFTSIRIIY